MTDTDRDDVRCPKCGSQTPIGHRCIVDDLEAIRNADLSDHPFMRAIRGKTDRDDVGMLAEVLAVHQLHSSLNVCLCGTWRAMAGAGPLIDQHRDHLAAALLASSAMADLKARWQGEALREAAEEAEERGDVGKDGGPEAWEWLRGLIQRAEIDREIGGTR